LVPFFYKHKRRNVVIIPTILFTTHAKAIIQENTELELANDEPDIEQNMAELYGNKLNNSR
jgi:metallo-beta-lactamase family protein